MSIGEIILAVIGAVATVFGGIYCPWKQNKIFERQNAIFAAQAGVSMPEPSAVRSPAKIYWPTFAALGVIVSIWLAVAYDIYDRRSVVAQQPWSGGQGPLIKAWGGTAGDCREMLDGNQLLKWSGKFNVAFVCGIIDPTMDRFEDERVTVSAPFTIHGGDIEMAVGFSKAMNDFQSSIVNKAAQGLPPGSKDNKGTLVIMQMQAWNETILLPKSSKTTDIHKLSDVSRNDGFLLSRGFPPE